MPKNLGPLTKPPKKRFELSPTARVLIKQTVIGVGVLASLALVITGIYQLTRLPSLTLTSVTASGGETIDASEVEMRAETVLEGTYSALIPKRFFLFYPQAAMLAEVEKVERIRDVVIDRRGKNELHISYNEHRPFALWCIEAEIQSDGSCLFINDEGYAFAPAPQLKGGSFVRYRSAAAAPELGQVVLSLDEFWNTITFVELLAEDELYVAAVEVDAVGDVYYRLTTGGELRVTLKDPAKQVADNLHTILAAKEFTHLRESDFHYIDLRFGNKVYVSEVDVSLLAASSTASTTNEMMATIPVDEDVALTNELQAATAIFSTEEN